MTRDEILIRVPVLNAWLEQKPISFRWKNNQTEHWSWTTFTIAHGNHPDIFNEYLEWMIIPEPPRKPREWWIGWCDHAPNVAPICRDKPIPLECSQCHCVHVREVLSSEPESNFDSWPFSVQKPHGVCTPQSPKDLAEPPDQQP
jgi:hypothetical protein